MKHAAFFLLLALIAASATVGCKPASASGEVQKVTVDEPRAPKPWSPPATKLPKEVVDRAAFLLAHGMGDPRGGEYRTASVYLGSLWGREDKAVEIHGWVLPKEGSGATWVVATNGLVYETQSVGSKADLFMDVQAMLTPPKQEQKTRIVSLPPIRVTPETAMVLLVAGHPDLAERIYEARPPGRFLHADFLSSWFDQAVTAHMRSDDRTALRVGRAVLRERPAFDKDALAKVDPRTGAGPNGVIMPPAGPYAYLDVLPALIEDTERRLREKPRPPLDPKTLGAQTVETLIDRLDEVAARQWGQPGGVNLADDPIVAALAAKGDAAAEPLFEAMENDKRLTRSVSFGRDFFPGRNLIPVRSAALAAFQAFAQTDNFPAGAVTRLDVPALRAYWKANRGKTGTDRWFGTLADDKAGWRRWVEAATRLFDREGVTRNGIVTTTPANKGAIKAEAVRGQTNPSLSDLLERRALDILDRNDEGLSGPSLLHTSLRIATDLGRWDPPRSVKVLRELTDRTIDALGEGRFSEDYVGTFLVPALEARAAAGDATAWQDYAKALSKVSRFPSFDSKILRPMADHPNVPEVREATKLLTTPGSIYNPIERMREEPGLAGYDPILISPLLKLPSLRRAALAGLADKTVVGTSWIDDRGNGWMEANGKPFPSQGVRPDEKDPKPKAGEKRPLRAADTVAHALARLKGAPRFQPFWTVAQKDAAQENSGLPRGARRARG